MSVNKVILLGNITKDTELRTTENGKKVAKTAIALNEKYKDSAGVEKENVTFLNLVIWGKLAETFESYVKQGQKLYVEGKIVIRSRDAEDGTKKYTTEVVVHKMEFAGGNKTEGSSSGEEINIEDIPF